MVCKRPMQTWHCGAPATRFFLQRHPGGVSVVSRCELHASWWEDVAMVNEVSIEEALAVETVDCIHSS